MQFGVQFFPCVTPEAKDARTYFRECLDVGVEAEALGFTHARMVEHYFTFYGGYSPNPIVFLSALAALTTKMRLVTGAVLPVFNNPLKLAGEIAMLDGISGGRLDVGVARAFLPHEFRRFRIPPDESYARFLEGLEQIALLLTQENVSHAGRFHVIENTTSLPRPTQKPRPKFYIAATLTPETFEYAGRNGHALMAIPLGGNRMRELLTIYRKAWRDSGRPGDGEVMIAFHMFCHADGAKAREISVRPIEDYFAAIAGATREWTEGLTSKDYQLYPDTMKKVAVATLPSQIESGGAWVGSPAEIDGIIERLVDRIGPFEHASLQINFGELPFEEAQRSMRLFAAEVMPKWRDR
jgi:alkanesulfonate monooxygenase SsuD/methylene tetrahydromethanopterin reductase-like flavin-dependent oxidoreductase (luciferase family)